MYFGKKENEIEKEAEHKAHIKTRKRTPGNPGFSFLPEPKIFDLRRVLRV